MSVFEFSGKKTSLKSEFLEKMSMEGKCVIACLCLLVAIYEKMVECGQKYSEKVIISLIIETFFTTEECRGIIYCNKVLQITITTKVLAIHFSIKYLLVLDDAEFPNYLTS